MEVMECEVVASFFVQSVELGNVSTEQVKLRNAATGEVSRRDKET